ncbi:MAG: FKBP-type peptidyl-prolyl cis-trans isomerase [Isosphaeraceae bacterium]
MIAGLRYGVEGMRVGGLRRLTISPHLARLSQERIKR